MNCAKHTEVPASAYCRTCGKALCAECARDVRGVIYCEECIAARLNGTLPKTGAAAAVPAGVVDSGGTNPKIAALLGFMPGVGAMYNGQYAKGFVHVGIFALLCIMASEVNGVFGVLIAAWVVYMVFDAHQTAKARKYGLPLPDPLGLNNFVMGSQPAATAAAPNPGTAYQAASATPYEAGTTYQAGAVPPVGYYEPEPAPRSSGLPVGALVLIGLGFLFLLQNVGIFNFHWARKLWPLILIAIGVNMFLRRRSLRSDRS